jgi:DNA-binding FrmR family transcriptional regulator
MADTAQKSNNSSRRNFLKIGAGVVAGAAIATVVEVPYYGSVIGGNSSSSSSSISSLKSQLSATQGQLSSTQEQLSSTAAQLNAAQGQVSSLNNQLSSTAAQLTSANSQLSGVNSQLTSTQQALTSANGQISTLNGQVSSLSTQVNSATAQVSTLQGQVTGLQTSVDTERAFIILSTKEQAVVEALAETMLPSTAAGPGAKEAGVIYFIDNELAGVYGFNAKNYMQGPFVQPNQSGPITVQSSNGPITYTAGTPTFGLDSGFYYQHPFQFREFWRSGILALEAYCDQAYGGDFETLTAAQKTSAIADLWANKPTNFTTPTPIEFASEVQEMVWAGFVMDPMHGGNRNMVGWTYLGFNGTNEGNFYNEGYTTKQLMVMSTPVRLKPASIGQLELSLT